MKGWPLSLRGFPRKIVYLGPDREPRHYCLKVHWDGRLRLSPRGPEWRAGKALLAVLDAAIPFRRLFLAPAGRRYTHNLLLTTAADAFPFDVDEAGYALGERGGKSYLFCLPGEELEALTADLGAARAVLVSESGDEGGIVRALEGWFRQGSLGDLLGRPRPLSPGGMRLAVLSLLVLAGGAVAVHSWLLRQEGLAQQEQAVLTLARNRAEPLLQQRQIIAQMLDAERALAGLNVMSGLSALERLNRFLFSFPSGSRITRIEFDGTEMNISGWGADPNGWMPAALDPNEVESQSYPKEHRFKISMPLEKGAVPAE